MKTQLTSREKLKITEADLVKKRLRNSVKNFVDQLLVLCPTFFMTP